MDLEDDNVIRGNYWFRGVDYVVTMKINGEESIEVEVEDPLVGELWRGTFDSAYIEDITHKTGNFKQFSIFVSMLESALNQTSDSVSLDLLTYSDLESLRDKKTGGGHRPTVTSKSSGLNTKRYLILTYTVEFDRIHYPLPLPYAGKQSPRHLQDVVSELRNEIRMLRGNRVDSECLQAELEKLQKNYDLVLEEKETIESEFSEYKKEVRTTTVGGAAKEIKVLKSMVKNLESDLMKEKNRHQRSASKRSQEYRQLLQEVEELRSSERNLKVRVKSLTNELAMYKRRQSKSPAMFGSQRSSQQERRRSSSADRTRTSFQRERSTSKERPASRGRPPTRDRLYNRSTSRERRGSYEGSQGSLRRNPSPAGTRKPRFDPTAYIKDRERKQGEVNAKRQRILQPSNRGSVEKTRPSPGYLKGNRGNRSRSSSVGSQRSQGYVSDGNASDSSQKSRTRNMKPGLKPGRTNSSSAWDSPNVPLQKPKQRQRSILTTSTPESENKWKRKNYTGKENYSDQVARGDPFNRSAEITEIDERLNRLQAFMKANMAS